MFIYILLYERSIYIGLRNVLSFRNLFGFNDGQFNILYEPMLHARKCVYIGRAIIEFLFKNHVGT